MSGASQSIAPAAKAETGPADFETRLRQDDRIELRAWLRLLTCTSLLERVVRRGLREEFGSTLPRLEILAQLEREPAGLTMGDLSQRLMVTNGNVTGLIDRMVAEGLVARRAQPGDRRIQVVRLTASGKQAFDAMAPAHQAWITTMMGALSRAELAQLHALLAKLKHSIVRADGLAPARQAANGDSE